MVRVTRCHMVLLDIYGSDLHDKKCNTNKNA